MLHTPGPWKWFGNTKGNLLYLATVNNGRCFVMRFKRWGMGGAQPMFQVHNDRNGVMVPASDLVAFEVGDHGIVGHKAALSDSSVYRYDVAGIEHPDAWLMQASPDLLAACEAFQAWDEDPHATDADGDDVRRVIAAAVKLAKEGRNAS